jgi:hypothetical protein
MNEISMMNGVVVERIAEGISNCAGELSSGALANVEPERQNMASDPEMSQLKIVSLHLGE